MLTKSGAERKSCRVECNFRSLQICFVYVSFGKFRILTRLKQALHNIDTSNIYRPAAMRLMLPLITHSGMCAAKNIKFVAI